MDATPVATAGVQPGDPTPQSTGATGRLEKLHRLHLLKQRMRELVGELDQLNEDLFGRGWRP